MIIYQVCIYHALVGTIHEDKIRHQHKYMISYLSLALHSERKGEE